MEPAPISPVRRRLPLLIALLAALALVSLGAGLLHATRGTGSTDFQYSAARLVLDHVDPYRLYPVDRSRFLLTQGPNYLPLLYLLLLPFGALDWPAARLAWAVVNLALAVGIAAMIARSFGAARGSPAAGRIAALLFLGALATRNTIGNGQHGLLVMAALLVALGRAPGALRGAGLSLAVTKLSLGAPFGALLAGRRDWVAVATGAALTLAGYLAFALLTHAGIEPALLTAPLTAIRAGIGYTAPLSWLVGVAGPGAAFALALLGLPCLFAWRWHQPADTAPEPAHSVLVATLVALLTCPHAIYDWCFLALPFAFGDPFATLRPIARATLAALLAYAVILQKPLVAVAIALTGPRGLELVEFAAWLGLVMVLVNATRREVAAG